MKNNPNYYKRLEEDICCCQEEKCTCERLTPCAVDAKDAWEKYIEAERCKPEPVVEYNICEYDPDQVYFMQYLSPRTLYKQNLIKLNKRET